MRRMESLQGVRMSKFLRGLSGYEAAEFPQLEAAELLEGGNARCGAGVSALRTRARLASLPWRLGKAPGKLVPAVRSSEVEALYRTRYAGFTAKHFHAPLAKDHNFTWGYPGAIRGRRRFRMQGGFLEMAPRRGAHRRKRPRRPVPGMLLDQSFGKLRSLTA
jgi:hypothetical protein